MLNDVVKGEDGAPPLLIAHGLFGSARNWGVIQTRLSDAYRVTAVDMRNHGGSPWTESHDYPGMADDLAASISRPSVVVGHSMGGKAAMMLALRHPEKVAGLIVADIAPIGYDHTQMDLIDAMRAVDLATINSRRDADAQLARHVASSGVRAFLLQSLDVAARRWMLNLDVLAGEMDAIVGWPSVDGTFAGPVLILSGGDSDYVRPEHHDPIRSYFPAARFIEIPDAGHWLHANDPRAVEAAIRGFAGDVTGTG